MAAVTYTTAQVAPLDCCNTEIFPAVAGETVAAGDVIAFNTSGLAVKADADGSAPLPQARGIALNAAGTGQAVSILKRGVCAGFSVSGLAYGAKLYMSGTAGVVSDASVSSLGPIGQVVPLPDSSATKVAYFEFDWIDGYA